MEKLNQMDTDGVNFRHQKQKEKAKKFSYEEAVQQVISQNLLPSRMLLSLQCQLSYILLRYEIRRKQIGRAHV